MEMEFRKLLSVLIKGTLGEIRSAKKEIEKLWHKNTSTFKMAAPIALEYLPKFDCIERIENQAAFVSGLSLFFLVLGDEHFDTLKNFSLKVFEHPNGSVREAIRKTADWLYVSLTERVEPFMFPKGKKLTEEQKIKQNAAQIQYLNLVKEIEFLIDKYDEGVESDQYIDEMKPSVNKSLQFFWSRLTESPIYSRILERIRPVPHEIARQKAKVEKELLAMLKKSKSDFSLEDIKDLIYNEDGQECLTDIISMFATDQSMTEPEKILKTISDAWNLFPHKTLGGLSPAEKILEYQDMQSRDKNLPN